MSSHTYLWDECLSEKRSAEARYSACNILTKRERKSPTPMVEISIPSMRILPLAGSVFGYVSLMKRLDIAGLTKRNMLITKVDFPLPVIVSVSLPMTL